MKTYQSCCTQRVARVSCSFVVLRLPGALHQAEYVALLIVVEGMTPLPDLHVTLVNAMFSLSPSMKVTFGAVAAVTVWGRYFPATDPESKSQVFFLEKNDMPFFAPF